MRLCRPVRTCCPAKVRSGFCKYPLDRRCSLCCSVSARTLPSVADFDASRDLALSRFTRPAECIFTGPSSHVAPFLKSYSRLVVRMSEMSTDVTSESMVASTSTASPRTGQQTPTSDGGKVKQTRRRQRLSCVECTKRRQVRKFFSLKATACYGLDSSLRNLLLKLRLE